MVTQILAKVSTYLESFIQLLETSQTLADLTPGTLSDRLYTLQQHHHATHSTSLQDSLHYLSTFVSVAHDLDQVLSSECLDRSQSMTLAEAKVKRLELYYSNNNQGGNPMIPAYQQANREKDELREMLEDEKQ